MSTKSLLIVGAGPGIAQATAIEFASKGFTHLYLIARSTSTLSKATSAIQSSNSTVKIFTYPCDVNDTATYAKTLALITKDLPSGNGSPDVILYNAAIVHPTTIADTDAETLVYDFRTTTVAMYQTAMHFIPAMVKSAAAAASTNTTKPVFLLTSSHLRHSSYAPFFSLGVAKAAQFSLTASLAQVYGPQGVNFGVASVNGVVQVGGPLDPKIVAGRFWEVCHAADSKDGGLTINEIDDLPASN